MNMAIITLRLIVDFGLVILIWMTQLIVYPAFLQMTEEKLHQWHKTYNNMITVLVAPLMFAQLGLVLWQLVQEASIYTLASTLFVVAAWALTFLQAVPLHRKIAEGNAIHSSARKLVQVNWLRTLVWSLVFVISLWYLA